MIWSRSSILVVSRHSVSHFSSKCMQTNRMRRDNLRSISSLGYIFLVNNDRNVVEGRIGRRRLSHWFFEKVRRVECVCRDGDLEEGREDQSICSLYQCVYRDDASITCNCTVPISGCSSTVLVLAVFRYHRDGYSN